MKSNSSELVMWNSCSILMQLYSFIITLTIHSFILLYNTCKYFNVLTVIVWNTKLKKCSHLNVFVQAVMRPWAEGYKCVWCSHINFLIIQIVTFLFVTLYQCKNVNFPVKNDRSTLSGWVCRMKNNLKAVCWLNTDNDFKCA